LQIPGQRKGALACAWCSGTTGVWWHGTTRPPIRWCGPAAAPRNRANLLIYRGNIVWHADC